jgi:hypothetical protein
VGSGKSAVALSYYVNKELIGDIYVITTAKKRDSLEWVGDAAQFGIGLDKESTVAGVLHIDSWNNISKYTDIEGAFFIFDEQRLVGSGAWVKSFYKIAKKNAWMVLSATPGDTWLDYIPVFVANGLYKNATAFKREHVVYAPFSRYPRVERYIGLAKLEAAKRDILVEMPYFSKAIRVHKEIPVFYDVDAFNEVSKDRWNIYKDKPVENISELFYTMRRVVNSHPSRLDAIRDLMEKHPKLIVFYNFNYELQILRELYDTWSDVIQVGEWNGHKKTAIPDGPNWVYLVQITAGAEGWNCVETNAMAFFSLTYSYKQFEQAQGRIDRLNTAWPQLYYYSLVSNSVIDRAVKSSLAKKKTFNERAWASEHIPADEWND